MGPREPGRFMRLPFRRACENPAGAEAPRRLASRSWSLDEPLVQVGVGIDPPVAKEWPPAADLFDAGWIDLSQDHFFPARTALGYHHAERVGRETCCPRTRSRPPPRGLSSPARLTAATYTPFAIAWLPGSSSRRRAERRQARLFPADASQWRWDRRGCRPRAER